LYSNSMVEHNYARIESQVAAAAKNRRVKIIGASKTVSTDRIHEVYDAGLRCFGENRIQEALPKIQNLPNDIEWHFIGHLQTNKAKDAVRHFAWIHSVDSERLLRTIEKEAAKQKKKMLLLIEINLGGEESKHGIEPSKLPPLLNVAKDLEWSEIRGLMAIPPFLENPEDVRPYFQKLNGLATPHQLPELSMGMSHDYVIAIEEGATMVRIGTALFGERKRDLRA
jgi:pyridoxal phosphate enzyme (YggS family)